jgi:hypothetical protein
MLAWASVSLGQPAAQYERSLDIAPLRLSQADLMQLIGKLRSLTETANIGAKTELAGWETLDLSGSDRTISLETGFSLNDFRRATATSFTVHYSFARPRAPISRVDLELYDWKRTLRVQGSAADQVDAIVAAFEQQIGDSTTILGGLSFRTWAGTFLMIVGVVLINLPIVVLGPTQKLTVMSAGITIVLLLWLAPWSRWFPGVAVYATEASLIVRNAAWISFIGTLVTISGLGLAIFLHVRSGTRQTSESNSRRQESAPRPVGPVQPNEVSSDNPPPEPPQA